MPVFPGDPFQPLYYIKLWESFGFNKAETYITTFSEFPKKEMLGPTEVKSLFSNMGLSLERLTVEFLEEIWLDFYRFLIEVFKGNQHYVPISFDEFSLQMKKFPLVLNGKYSYIVFDKNRKPIAFISALIDVYLQHYQEHKIDNPLFSGKKLILKTIATHPEWQNKRVGTLISNAVFAKGIENGYKKVIIALMMEENISAKGAERKFDSEPEVQYALYKLKNHGE
jgi:GNAT superfamily N-acetyltransferase